MDEAHTLSLLGWIVGSILAIAFVLNAVALALLWSLTRQAMAHCANQWHANDLLCQSAVMT
jgi:hypothetical protein